ncbi:hypothetical protein IAR55_003952 [Kwoniella newhampshirensis]|uniref:Proteasome assembly chaperone 3 n=1 Tax=Kwoniella newhampshirensis TaxID=1651941 RepID=A0AAW0YY00_9TREE
MSSLLEEAHPVEPPSFSSLNLDTSRAPPLPSYQLRRSVAGIETELLIQTFDDRILVIVTQNGKVGCLTQASIPPHTPLPPPTRPTPIPDPTTSSSNSNSNTTSSSSTVASTSRTLSILSILPIPPPSLTLTPLLGSPPSQTLHELYVSQIATLVFWALETSGLPRRNVVVGLSLVKFSTKTEEDDDQDGGFPLELEDDARGAGHGGERERFAGIMEMVSNWNGPETS